MTLTKKRERKGRRSRTQRPLPMEPAIDTATNTSLQSSGLETDRVLSTMVHPNKETVFQFGMPNSMQPKSVWDNPETTLAAFQQPVSGPGFASYDELSNGFPTSFLKRDQTNERQPSFGRPRSPSENEQNIVQAKDGSELHQTPDNDWHLKWQLQVRDDRIKFKDQQIAQLKAEAEKESQDHKLQMEELNEANIRLEVRIKSEEYVRDSLRGHIKKLEQQLKDAVNVKDQKEDMLRQLDLDLRILHNNYVNLRMENRALMDRTFADYLLAKLRTPTADGQVLTRLLNLIYQAVAGPVPHQLIQLRNIESSPFPFMRLPGELRNMIYRQCLVLGRPIDLWPLLPYNAPAGTTKLSLIERDLKHINVSLLRVSRRVNQEATPVLYGCNRFRFSDSKGWTIALGFLRSIHRNFQYLTNISVPYPDEGGIFLVNRESGAAPGKQMKEEMRVLLRRFGYIGLDTANGLSSRDILVHEEVQKILVDLPAIKSLSMIVPHNLRLHREAFSFLLPLMNGDHWISYDWSSSNEDGGPVRWEDIGRGENRERSFIFIRRNPDYQARNPLNRNRDLDDDVRMGRALLGKVAVAWGANIKYAEYGSMEDGMSYVVEGGEDRTDIDLHPGDPEDPGRRPMFSLPDFTSIFRRM
ncbi:uncharacterized protein EI97DRAFT_441848 [Westerdykella ornata]|uniref:Uncharacterized protein n=1 Tax=Westerdykella ornata TaxID=318751 RepID=A0A6A6JLV8_WESOR|nr:uncharacterized protein EI97DRAFT_441848 [Westerdykella ornata]KAF2277093.1 hypothetical protein EI97DRAFT_441848 [Westerdykella ornata]